MTSPYNCIYLLQTREFVTSVKPIYKLGKTTKPLLTRFNQYHNGSRLILHFIMDERELKDTKVSVTYIDKSVKVTKPKKIVKPVKDIEEDKFKTEKDNETQNNNYDCKRCGLYFKEKKYLIQHLKKKIYCMAVNGNTLPEILLKEIQFVKKGGIECYKCNKFFNKYYLDKHKCSNKNELEYLKEEIKQIHKILTKPK